MNISLLLLLLQLLFTLNQIYARPLVDLSKSKKALENPLKLAKSATKLLKSLGTGTYYDVAAGIGSCGQLHSNDDMVVALNYHQMENGENPNKNPHCNQQVKIKGDTGDYVTAQIVDTCPGCDVGCLDMSSAVFLKVCGSLDLGVCKISWDFE